jgi:hypothetical protein
VDSAAIPRCGCNGCITGIKLYDSTGKEVEHAFLTAADLNGGQHRLEVVTVKGLDRPGLLYSVGNPTQYYWSNLVFIDRGTLLNVNGWHPKMTPLWAAGVTVQPDGIVAATAVHSRIPEPLRIAHLIATGIVLGESSKRDRSVLCEHAWRNAGN